MYNQNDLSIKFEAIPDELKFIFYMNLMRIQYREISNQKIESKVHLVDGPDKTSPVCQAQSHQYSSPRHLRAICRIQKHTPLSASHSARSTLAATSGTYETVANKSFRVAKTMNENNIHIYAVIIIFLEMR